MATYYSRGYFNDENSYLIQRSTGSIYTYTLQVTERKDFHVHTLYICCYHQESSIMFALYSGANSLSAVVGGVGNTGCPFHPFLMQISTCLKSQLHPAKNVFLGNGIACNRHASPTFTQKTEHTHFPECLNGLYHLLFEIDSCKIILKMYKIYFLRTNHALVFSLLSC